MRIQTVLAVPVKRRIRPTERFTSPACRRGQSQILRIGRTRGRVSAGAGRTGNRFYVRRFWTGVARRQDFIGPRFKRGGFFNQHRGELRVPCCAGETQKRHCLARQVPSTDHRETPNETLRAVNARERNRFRKKCIKVTVQGSTRIAKK
jgi:hypothetical protein